MNNTTSKQTEEIKLSLDQAKVLKVMIDWDHTWFSYNELSIQTDVSETKLKKMMKEMSSLGWVEYIKGLLNDDGEAAGSGWFVKYPFEYRLRDALRAYQIEAPDNWKVVEAWRTIKNWTIGKHHEVTASVNILLEIERKRVAQELHTIEQKHEREMANLNQKVLEKMPEAIENALDSLNGVGIDPKSYEYRLVETWMNNLIFHLEVALTNTNTKEQNV